MSYLIKDTTKEERNKMVRNALGISACDNAIPTDYTMELVKEYVDGNMELDNVLQKVIEHYKQ